MDVRLASAADGDAVRNVRLRALRDAPDAFGGTFGDAVDRPPEYWLGWTEGRGWDAEVRTWLADDRGRVRGMAVGSRSHADPATVDVFGMWVEPEARGTGIASRLVGMVRAWALGRGAARMRLHVSEGNGRAEAFYAKLGFRRTDAPSRPLRAGSDVRIYEMELPLRA